MSKAWRLRSLRPAKRSLDGDAPAGSAKRPRSAGPVGEALAGAVSRGVSEAEICSIANAICSELQVGDCASSTLLEKMQRLHETGHANRVFNDFSSANLAADFPVSYVSIGWQHPVLKLRDVIAYLSANGKLHHFVKDPTLQDYSVLWKKFRKLQPDHPIYDLPVERRRRTIPVLIHADEGTSQKKRALMIVSVQPVIGNGTSFGGKQVNFVGNSLTTRFLYTTIMGRCYRKKHAIRLTKLIDSLANDLKDLFSNPVHVLLGDAQETLFVSCVGVKGDWPALCKLGGLNRHHGREAHQTASAGICHLCNAGQPGHDFHRFDFTSMLKARTSDLPWTRPSSLSKHIPQSPSKKEMFYKIDLFHVGHKGVMGDVCANAIVSLFDLSIDGMSISSGLDSVYEELAQYAKENSLPLHMLQLSRTILGYPNSWSFPAAGWFKGADTTTLTYFLEHRFAKILSDDPGHEHATYIESILACLRASSKIFKILYRASLWLTDGERDAVIDSLRDLLANFKKAAGYSFNVLKLTRFKFQPKYHMLSEVRYELICNRQLGVESLNALAFSCQMDEDFVGRLAQMSRFVSSKAVHRKTVERYKLAVASVW